MDFELTWFESRKCWKKYRNGKVHYLGKGKCKGKYDMDGYHAALNEWKLIEGDIIQAEKKKQLEDQLFETDSAKLKAIFMSVQERAWHEEHAKAPKDNLSAHIHRTNLLHGLPWSCMEYRHTFGSPLAQKGVSLFKIAILMGNSPEICRKHYAALVPQEMHDEVEF